MGSRGSRKICEARPCVFGLKSAQAMNRQWLKPWGWRQGCNGDPRNGQNTKCRGEPHTLGQLHPGAVARWDAASKAVQVLWFAHHAIKCPTQWTWDPASWYRLLFPHGHQHLLRFLFVIAVLPACRETIPMQFWFNFLMAKDSYTYLLTIFFFWEMSRRSLITLGEERSVFSPLHIVSNHTQHRLPFFFFF